MNLTSNPFHRRQFLKASAAGFGALGLGAVSPFLRQARAGGIAPGKKLLFIFLRGGIDGVGTVLPYGDAGIPGTAPTYLEARPRLGVQPGDAHDLNGFCSLHPSMQGNAPNDPKLYDIFQGSFDPSRAFQQLAVLLRIGYANQNRSHFSSQQFLENGRAGDVKSEKGVLNRYVGAYLDEAAPMQAATINGNQMVIMKGDVLIPVLRTVGDYALPQNVLLGTLPSKANPLGSGLKGAYGQVGYRPNVQYNELTYDTGKTLLESLQFFQDSVLSVRYEPKADAAPYYQAINDQRFRSSIQDSARLLRQIDDIQIVACNQDGYDTHGGQNQRLPNLQRDLALAFTALYNDLADIWDDVVVLTVSEFGRTTIENGNLGTDHGQATINFAMGGSGVGGVYDGDAATWPNGTLTAANQRYVLESHDYRAVYHEVLTKHLGDPDNRMDEIIPGYSELVANDTRGLFDSRGFVAS